MSKKWLVVGLVLAIIISGSLLLGPIPPSPLYYLKVSREALQNLFIFGDEDRASWILTKADKRLTEAQKLRNKGLYFFVDIQVNKAKHYQSQAQVLLEILKNKTNITYLQDRFNQNKEKISFLEGN